MRIKTAALTFLSLTAVIVSALNGTAAFSTTLAGHLEQMQVATTGGAALKVGLSRSDCFPDTYEGLWHCETVVVGSAVEAVAPGQAVQCDVQFIKDASGAVVSAWKQDGWSEGQSTVTAFNTLDSQMDRTSYCMNGSNTGLWAARSRGQFTKVGPDQIIAKSVVDQYIDGQYVGRYQTTSILTREMPENNLAIIETREPNDNVGPAYLYPNQYPLR